MSDLQVIASRLQSMGDIVDSAQTAAAAASAVISEAVDESVQAVGSSEYGGRLQEVGETVQQLQERVAGLADGIRQAGGLLGQVPGESELVAMTTVLSGASQAVDGLDGDIQDAAALAETAMASGAAAFQGSDPGPLLAALGDVTTALSQLTEGVTDVNSQIAALISRLSTIGSSGN